MRRRAIRTYGTVSQESSVNANLAIQSAEVDSAIAQGSPFSPVCQVYAPIYRQVTLADLEQHPNLDFGPAKASLQSSQTAKAGLQVVCVNPAALSGGTARPLAAADCRHALVTIGDAASSFTGAATRRQIKPQCATACGPP